MIRQHPDDPLLEILVRSIALRRSEGTPSMSPAATPPPHTLPIHAQLRRLLEVETRVRRHQDDASPLNESLRSGLRSGERFEYHPLPSGHDDRD